MAVFPWRKYSEGNFRVNAGSHETSQCERDDSLTARSNLSYDAMCFTIGAW